MPAYSLKVHHKSELHKKLVKRVGSRFQLAQKAQQERHWAWSKAEESVLGYVAESEADAVRRTARENGEPRYTTIMLPYSYATLMSAHTYWTSVFFARTPVHQFMGRHGETEMQVQALEALMSYQTEVGRMMAPYYLWLYDAGKYGHGVLGQFWTVDKIAFGQMVEIERTPGAGDFELYQTTQEIEGYRGNRVYNVSPYDFFHDPRVPLTRFQEGEFCIARKRMSWADILKRQSDGYFINVDEIHHHASPDKGSTDGSPSLLRPDFHQHQFDDFDFRESEERNKDKKHPSGCSFLECYIHLIPDEWGLGPSRLPQKWCITVTEDMGLVVGATPLGYMHGEFPFDVLEPEVEGYGIFNRGIPEIMEPIQNVMDWLVNTHFFNVRTSLNNQFIVDPSRLVIKDIQNTGPGFIWRLRPEAYGTDISKMFMQVPVQDVTRAHMADLNQMLAIGEKTLGVNEQIMGGLGQGGGGRKTATEVRTSTGFGVNRMKTISEYMSAHGFSPHAQKLVQSSQQLYDATAKMRIVGDLAVDAGPAFMDVGPEEIAGFYNFVPVDGTMPIDRLAQATLWKEIFANLRNMPPQMAMGYDWAKMFGWMASLAGLKNIHQFKVKVVPDGSMQPQVDAGNVIAMPPPSRALGNSGGPGGGAMQAAGINAALPRTS